MGSYNRVILLGNLTRDPEVRSLPTGQTVTELGLATNRTYRVGGPDGEKREEVTFVDVSVWGRQGEIIAQYFQKGHPILIEGRLQFRTWEDKDGNKRSKLSVVGESFQFVADTRPKHTSAPQANPPATGGAPAGDNMTGFDEVPF